MTAPQSPEVALLLALNAQYLRAALHSDLAWFERHLAGDFLCSLPDGALVDRPAFFERLRAPSRLSELDAHEVVVRFLGDVAIVHARTSLVSEGRPGRGRYTDIWARRSGRWLAVAAHVTRC